MKVFVKLDELYPFYNFADKGCGGYGVAMTTKKHSWCMKVFKEFDKVQTYLKKRYEE